MDLLPESFAAGDPAATARFLLGQHLVREHVVLRITEVEAYGGSGDSASHASRGRTPRNAPMFGPPGRAYVYLCYGIHNLLNVSCGPVGQPGAVLVRGCEIVDGHELIAERRGGRIGPGSLAGPGKVGAALDVHVGFSGHVLGQAGGLELRSGPQVTQVVVGPRIGIGYAEPACQHAPLRFAVAGSRQVSQPRGLRPIQPGDPGSTR